MPLKPIHLRRRRWTLLFTAPFAVFMLATFAYSVFLLIAIDERLVKLIAGASAFAVDFHAILTPVFHPILTPPVGV